MIVHVDDAFAQTQALRSLAAVFDPAYDKPKRALRDVKAPNTYLVGRTYSQRLPLQQHCDAREER
jgi:hypothetical protein